MIANVNFHVTQCHTVMLYKSVTGSLQVAATVLQARPISGNLWYVEARWRSPFFSLLAGSGHLKSLQK